jgi:hypothetical protein
MDFCVRKSLVGEFQATLTITVTLVLVIMVNLDNVVT